MDLDQKRAANAEAQRKWRAKNKEHLREYCRKRRAENPEKFRQQNREFRAKHPGYDKERYYENHERVLERQRIRRKLHPNKHREWAVDAERKRRYGISREQFNALLDACNHTCPICRSKFQKTGRRKPCVDHCHNTKVIRGLLCCSCNTAEGLLGSVNNIRRLYEYALKNELFYQGSN